MQISFGPGGNSNSFKKLKFPADLAEYLKALNLNAYEIECGHGINISTATYQQLPTIVRENNIILSIHSPYYISLSSIKEETRTKSIDYILQTAYAADKLGAKKVVIHSGSCGKLERSEALEIATNTLRCARYELNKNNLGHIILCPETMGKINQLGTVEEVLTLCKIDEKIFPCIDFGHLHARTHGGLADEKSFKDIFDAIEKELGEYRLCNMHIHFSKIEYTDGGEKAHRTFADNNFGPDYKPLIKQILQRNLSPSIICESAGTQAEDASEMAKYYRQLKFEQKNTRASRCPGTS